MIHKLPYSSKKKKAKKRKAEEELSGASSSKQLDDAAKDTADHGEWCKSTDEPMGGGWVCPNKFLV